jgi:hypothetical protein
LPGGIDAYVQTLFHVIDSVHATAMTKDQLIDWFMKHYPQVKSRKTAAGYVNVPRALGATAVKDGKIVLTPEGVSIEATKSIQEVYALLHHNILGVEEIMEFFHTAPSPRTEADVLAFLKESLGIEWTTFAQVNFRLLWLVNTGKLQRVGSAYRLA